MPSSKRRSSGGASIPSTPPAHASPSAACNTPPGRELASQTLTKDSKIVLKEGNGSSGRSSYDVGFEAVVVAVEDKDENGQAYLFMSKAAMVAAPVAIKSLVSVCVANGADIPECGGVGTNMAVAVAWPSGKLERNEVKVSRVLASTLGSLTVGSTIYIKALEVLSSIASPTQASAKVENFKWLKWSVVFDCVNVSLRWCPPSEAVLATDSILATHNLSVFSKDRGSFSSPLPQTPGHNGHEEFDGGFAKALAVSESPGNWSPVAGTPVSRGSPSPGAKSQRGAMQSQRKESPTLKNWSSVRASLQKGKESVKVLLGKCAAKCISGRHLLLGNFVHLPLYGCDCIFLVTDVNAAAQTTSDSVDYSKVTMDCTVWSAQCAVSAVQETPLPFSEQYLPVYLVGDNTVVTLLPPVEHDTDAEGGKLDVGSCPASGAIEEAPGSEVDPGRLEFSSLGGLSVEIEELKQHMELSLLHPEHLKQYGLEPVRGVLLHGPPGTGKSSLARAAAYDAGVKLFAIDGPDIVSELYGESEAHLREIFASAARAAPSVVFIDELDALVPARQEGSEELGQRLVAALLTLMDGGVKETLEGVLVIAATNRVDSIDPALRRPGRFDVEIEIGVPSPADRQDILRVLLRDMRHELSLSDVKELAATSHGFVGADLAALCNEAAMSALSRRVYSQESLHPVDLLAQHLAGFSISSDSSKMKGLPHLQSVGNQSVEHSAQSEGQALSWKITLEDFQVAKTKVRPSAMREVALEVPRVRWSDIGGQDDVKQKLKEIVEWPQKHSDAMARMGIDPPHGVLLHGPPGCSKTLMARAVATEAGLNFIAVKGPELFSKWVGESEKAIKKLFARARAAAPSVVFFDEIDSLATQRGDDGVSVGDRVMSQLLIEMDGLLPLKGVSVIAATNRLDIIDNALLRPGRFDRVLYVGPPDEAARQQIFGIHLRHVPCDPDVSHAILAAQTQNYTGADISAVCQEAALTALAEDIDAKVVRMCHFLTALSQVKASNSGSS